MKTSPTGTLERNGRRVIPAIAVLLFLAVLCQKPARADTDEHCNAQLTVELTPDVPDAGDDGFLSSLLNNHPDYQLQLIQKDDPSVIELQLSGPGPEYRCELVIQTMRNDGRVLSVHVDSDTASAGGASVTPYSGALASAPKSELGLGALNWAIHHPREAWRIVLPIQASDAPDKT